LGFAATLAHFFNWEKRCFPKKISHFKPGQRKAAFRRRRGPFFGNLCEKSIPPCWLVAIRNGSDEQMFGAE